MKSLPVLCAAGVLLAASQSASALSVAVPFPGVSSSVPSLPVVGAPVALPALPASLPAMPDLALSEGATLDTKSVPATPEVPDAPALPDVPTGLPVDVRVPAVPPAPKKVRVTATGGIGGKWIVKPGVVAVDGLPNAPSPLALTGPLPIPALPPTSGGIPQLPVAIPAAPSSPLSLDGVPVSSLPASAPPLPGLPDV